VGKSSGEVKRKRKKLPVAASFSSDDLGGIEGELLRVWTSSRENTASMKLIPIAMCPVEGGSFPMITTEEDAVGLAPTRVR
jgi:hypothetical protein